jgi:hypothetical protein
MNMPALRRVTKKIIYAAGFFATILAIILLLILPQVAELFRRPLPPPPKQSILVESVDVVLHEQTLDAVARVRNPNPRDGIPGYTVVFVLENEQREEISRIPVATYLLPGSVRYVSLLNVPRPGGLAQIRVETPAEPAFVTVPNVAIVPTFNSFLREITRKTIGSLPIEEQRGVVTNRSPVGYNNVDLIGVAFAADGRVIGISQTFIGELDVAEPREFTLQWPAPSVPTERVIVIPTTNIFDQANIIDVRGDPSRLRE